MAADYITTARRVNALRGVATDQREIDYWHGYRLGMVDSLPNADPDARAQHEAGYALTSRSVARRDASRAIIALGYWDGRRWEPRPVRDFYQRLSIADWLSAYGQIYGIANETYVRQMCRQHSDFRTGNPAQLPAPWEAEKSGDTWIITITTNDR